MVILVHGLLAGPRSMRCLADHLSQHQFGVTTWRYRTMRQPIARHANRLRQQLEMLAGEASIDKIHFVTHSLGGLVVRVALQKPLRKLGRVVMLAPPNGGSHLTRIPLGPFQWLFPPLVEMHESPDSFVNQLPIPQDVEIGILAAADDKIVRVDSTHLACQKDHRILKGGHIQLPQQAEACREVVQFLRTGYFRKQAEAPRNFTRGRTWAA